MAWIYSWGIGDVEEGRQQFLPQVEKETALEYIRRDCDFVTEADLEKLRTDGMVTYPAAFDELDWIRLEEGQ